MFSNFENVVFLLSSVASECLAGGVARVQGSPGKDVNCCHCVFTSDPWWLNGIARFQINPLELFPDLSFRTMNKTHDC
jgi:hypothetical protein